MSDIQYQIQKKTIEGIEMKPYTPPQIRRINHLNRSVHDMMMTISPAPSFDDSPPPSPSKNYQSHVGTHEQASSSTTHRRANIIERQSEIPTQTRSQRGREISFESEELPHGTNAYLSDDDHFIISRKLLRRRHVRKERHSKKRSEESQFKQKIKRRKLLNGQNTVHNNMIQLLSQAVRDDQLNRAKKEREYATSTQKWNDTKKICSLSYVYGNKDIDVCDSPLIKRRLRFRDDSWDEGPTISPQRNNHVLCVAGFFSKP